MKAGQPGRRMRLRTVSTEFLTHAPSTPICNCPLDVVSTGSLWNELPDVAPHYSPRGCCTIKQQTDLRPRFCSLCPPTLRPLCTWRGRTEMRVGQRWARCQRSWLVGENSYGEERRDVLQCSPVPLPLLDVKGELSTKSLRDIVKQARGLRTISFAHCVSGPCDPAQLLFFFFSFFGEESCQLTLEGSH